MPRSRSRERRRRSVSRSKDRRSRSRDRKKEPSKDKRSRSRDRDRDYKRRDKSIERFRKDRGETSRKRSRDRSREKQRDRSREKQRDRSRERQRDRSNDRHRDRKDRKRDKSTSRSRRQKSVSSDKNSSHKSSVQLETVKPVVIVPSNNNHKSRKGKGNASDNESNRRNPYDHREVFEIANEFSQEGFEQFTRDHGIDFTNIETDDDREKVHEKMEELLKAHFAAQGKIYPPPKQEKPTVNAATGFVNDGSFLEQFKRMEDEYKQQQEAEQKRLAEEERIKSLPVRRRRGGKILKTGVVAKTKVNQSSSDKPADAWEMYIKEVQKYKNASCDSESKTRPLVK